MPAADYIVDIGPGAGDHGGEVVAAGTPEEVMANPDSLTGQYLSAASEFIPLPEPRPRRERQAGWRCAGPGRTT